MRSVVIHSGIAIGALLSSLPIGCLSVDPVIEGGGGGGANGGATAPGGGITKSPNTPRDPDKPSTRDDLCARSFTPVSLQTGAPKKAVCSNAELQAIATACPLNTGMDTTDCVSARATYATCASCIFGTDSVGGAKPIMLTPGVNPGFQLNQHTCFDYATGISGCGAQYINQRSCLDVFCENGASCKAGAQSREDCERTLAAGRCSHVRATDSCLTAATAQTSVCTPTGKTLADYTAFFIRFTDLACGTSIPDAGTD